jgi:hypothetical protein
MKQFNNIEEMEKYLNKETGTYEFIENGEVLDIEINFDLATDKYIFAKDINARSINAWDIKACDIDAWNIDAWNIDARNINAWDIKANTIKAITILFDVVCFAHHNIICEYIKGMHENSKYFSVYGEIIIKEEK